MTYLRHTHRAGKALGAIHRRREVVELAGCLRCSQILVRPEGVADGVAWQTFADYATTRIPAVVASAS